MGKHVDMDLRSKVEQMREIADSWGGDNADEGQDRTDLAYGLFALRDTWEVIDAMHDWPWEK